MSRKRVITRRKPCGFSAHRIVETNSRLHRMQPFAGIVGRKPGKNFRDGLHRNSGDLPVGLFL
jgi:hypothetical protein